MNIRALFFCSMILLAFSLAAEAKEMPDMPNTPASENELDELDPFAPNIDEVLEGLDERYEEATGTPAIAPLDFSNLWMANCYRQSCAVWARVVKSEQRLYLYVNGRHQATYATSTGVAGRSTPNFDTHPNGRIYDSYTSTKFPGGDYNGLGNMPYAVFISGGFAIHGTGQGNWKYLGSPASHGCIRIHPDNAYRFNRLVRSVGVGNTWITVQ